MTYASQDDLIDRYGERLLVDLTDREEAATGQIDTSAVTKALEDADAEIDGYLANRYQLPLSVTPPTIVKLACVLAIWGLHTYDPSEKIVADYKAAQQKLREIASGVYSLPAAGVEPDTTGGSSARVTDREKPFTPAKLKGFI